MPWARDGSSFRKHLHIEHKCKCGKVIRGNGFYNHAKSCPIWQEWKYSNGRNSQRILTNQPIV